MHYQCQRSEQHRCRQRGTVRSEMMCLPCRSIRICSGLHSQWTHHGGTKKLEESKKSPGNRFGILQLTFQQAEENETRNAMSRNAGRVLHPAHRAADVTASMHSSSTAQADTRVRRMMTALSLIVGAVTSDCSC